MNDQTDYLADRLNEIILLEGNEPIEKLGGYIVGELMGDNEGKYSGLYESNAKVQRIGDLASDIEISNGTPEELNEMWREIKQHANSLKKRG
jgi:hypothetical protein